MPLNEKGGMKPMAAKITIAVDSCKDIHDILLKMWKGNLITKEKYVLSMNTFRHKKFPRCISIDLENVANLVTNPIVKKMFSGKIQTAADSCIQKFIEAKD